MNDLLNQAYEESRYYRKFHHTIFVLAITLYAGFMALQLNSSFKLPDNITNYLLVAAGLGLILPIYIVYLIIHYHHKIVKMNAAIYDIAKPDLDNGKYGNFGVLSSDSPVVEELLKRKYSMALEKNCNPICVGRGHWFFLIVIFILVAINDILLLSNIP